MQNYPKLFLEEVSKIAASIDLGAVDRMIENLLKIRENKGRLFFLGVGGSAANCSHAVNDFRKLAGFEAYSAADNVAELTARTNDEGWETVFKAWLEVSQLSSRDGIFILSVGGGNKEKGLSVNLIHAIDLAKERGARILGIVGRDGGYTAKNAHAHLLIPTQSPATLTPQAEGWQGILWHMIVSDPRIMKSSNKWESVTV